MARSKYGFLNLVATTLFLITTGYLYGIFGTLNMADTAAKAPGTAIRSRRWPADGPLLSWPSR